MKIDYIKEPSGCRFREQFRDDYVCNHPGNKDHLTVCGDAFTSVCPLESYKSDSIKIKELEDKIVHIEQMLSLIECLVRSIKLEQNDKLTKYITTYNTGTNSW